MSIEREAPAIVNLGMQNSGWVVVVVGEGGLGN